jgi:hypothetical protein
VGLGVGFGLKAAMVALVECWLLQVCLRWPFGMAEEQGRLLQRAQHERLGKLGMQPLSKAVASADKASENKAAWAKEWDLRLGMMWTVRAATGKFGMSLSPHGWNT